MFWFYLVIVAHLLNAIVFIIDKYLLCNRITKPFVYAFYLGFLGLIALIFIPLAGLVLPSTFHLLINLSSGASFIIALIIFYHALQQEEPSRVIPIVGALVSIFTPPLSYLLLKERLSEQFISAIIFLIIGGALMAIRKFQISSKFLMDVRLWLLSSLFFALSYISIKFTYFYQPFLSGFIWARIGGFLVALCLLLIPEVRKSIFSTTKSLRSGTTFLFLINQLMAASSFVLINLALALASVSLINSLQGIQYIFILILASYLTRTYPRLLTEQITVRQILQKIVAIILISVGVSILFL